MSLSRAELARWWGIFVLPWCVAALVTLQINFLVCYAENRGPQSGSARALPIAVLAAVGGYGIWRRSKHFLSRAAIVAVAALVPHFIVLAVLPG
jgi:hypothetical protein